MFVLVLLLVSAAVTYLTTAGPDIPADLALQDPIAQAYSERFSDWWVEAGGVVERVLADDVDGDRHQRFIVRTRAGLTVLIAHNIDQADPVPIKLGDAVEFRGKYEWNSEGGVVHWTHDGYHGGEGGWIRHRGEVYK